MPYAIITDAKGVIERAERFASTCAGKKPDEKQLGAGEKLWWLHYDRQVPDNGKDIQEWPGHYRLSGDEWELEFVESVVKYQPGFLSATLHKSTDGARIVNYAQWQSKATWQAAFESPAVRAYSKNPFQYAKPDGHDYEVYHVTDCPKG